MQVFTHKLIYLRKECGYLQPKNHFHLAWDLNELHSCRSYTYHEGRTEIYVKLIVEKALIKEKVQVNYANNLQKSVGLGHVMYFFRLRVHWFENKIITDRLWNGKSFRKAKFKFTTDYALANHFQMQNLNSVLSSTAKQLH